MIRVCSVCRIPSVIGHGWISRHAHDATHTRMRLPRGICKFWHLTLTMLPEWLIPWGHYSLLAGQDRPLEECVPESADNDRSADRSTVRRWLLRRAQLTGGVNSE